jgi:hypothetical protein
MDLVIERQVAELPDLRHRIRQLRWFKASFHRHAELLGQRYALPIRIDDVRLTEAFLNWAERFSAEKRYASLDRKDFVTFNAGLLLRELLQTRPVEVETRPDNGALPSTQAESWPIAHAWPEGFICTNYCLCILAAVLDQEGTPLTLAALADDLRTWWSYRENVAEDPAQAIAFLDLFTGNEPNWFMPDSVASRSAMKRAIAAKILPIAAVPPPESIE